VRENGATLIVDSLFDQGDQERLDAVSRTAPHPGDFETVRQLLGHTSIDTTRRFYADFDRFFAHHQYLKVLEGEALA
jgi:hypothetical protein